MRRPATPLVRFAVGLASLALLGGCGPEGRPLATKEARRGAATFSLYCSPCHGRDGRGVEAKAPPLEGSPSLAEPPSLAARIVVHGLDPSTRPGGDAYPAPMPAFGRALSDAQIADVVTYVRERFGGEAAPVEPGEVARARSRAAAPIDLGPFTSGRASRRMKE